MMKYILLYKLFLILKIYLFNFKAINYCLLSLILDFGLYEEYS